MKYVSMEYAALQSPNHVVLYISGLQNKAKFEQQTSTSDVLYTA